MQHGHTSRSGCSAEYNAWKAMRARCTRPSHVHYPLYGARGIAVCSVWMASFAAFLRDMGTRPSPQHTLEREDNDGDYEPGNCRWATRLEQAQNTRRNVLVTWRGRTECVTEWARIIGIPRRALVLRLRTWPLDRAMTYAPSATGPAHPLAKITGEKALEIVSAAAAGASQRRVATMFGVSQATVSRVVRGHGDE